MALTHLAESTHSFLKLMPLSLQARKDYRMQPHPLDPPLPLHPLHPLQVREDYLMQVLREVYQYSGDVRGVPQDLFDFMSERAAGNPKYTTETLTQSPTLTQSRSRTLTRSRSRSRTPT